MTSRMACGKQIAGSRSGDAGMALFGRAWGSNNRSGLRRMRWIRL